MCSPVSFGGRGLHLDPEVLKKSSDAAADLVTDRADRVHALAGRVLQHPVLVALAGIPGQVSPQPIVMTTSESCTASEVRIFGFSAEMSMPSPVARRGRRTYRIRGRRPGRTHLHLPAGEVVGERRPSASVRRCGRKRT